MNDTEKNQLINRASELARERFVREKFNCAESTLWGLSQALELPVNDGLLRAVTPFGGGFGDSRATCGALVAGAIALGLVFGRTELDNDQKRTAYAHTRAYYRQFTSMTGGETCDQINELSFDHPELRTHCARFVTLAAELAAAQLLSTPAGPPGSDARVHPSTGGS